MNTSPTCALNGIDYHLLLLTSQITASRVTTIRGNGSESWCYETQRSSLPASDDTLTLWVTAMLRAGLKTATVLVRIAGVEHRLKVAGCPVEAKPLRALVKAAKRIRREGERQMRPITAEQLWRVSRLMDPGTVRGIRDRAGIVVGVATGMRRSELAGLEVDDVHFVEPGLLISLKRSKTDQYGVGRVIGVFRGQKADSCPVRTLEAWIRCRGQQPGPLFYAMRANHLFIGTGITREAISQVIKGAVRNIALDSPQYAGHSLRAGFVTCAGENGASELSIMKRTGHRNSATIHRYMRPVEAFTNDPLAGKL